MQIEPGIYEKVPFEEYLKWDCFSHSMVRYISKSPKHLKSQIETGDYNTDAMKFGNAFECLLLEPELYTQQYEVLPELIEYNGKLVEWNNRLKVCQNYKKDACNKGLVVLSIPESNAINDAVRECREHPAAAELLDGSKYQVSVVWDDLTTGVRCKARLDVYKEGEHITDIKTTTDASAKTFSRHLYNFNYHVQAAMYTDALLQFNGGAVLPYYFIVSESVAPYCTAVYALGADSILTGQNAYRTALNRYADVKRSGQWYGYSDLPIDIEIPAYAINTEGDDDGI